MTDQVERERLSKIVSDTLKDEYEGNLPVGNIPLHEMEEIATALRAAMPKPTVQEAAKVLLAWSGDYMPTAARVPAVKSYLEVIGTTARPAAISAAWLAALRAIAEQEGE